MCPGRERSHCGRQPCSLGNSGEWEVPTPGLRHTTSIIPLGEDYLFESFSFCLLLPPACHTCRQRDGCQSAKYGCLSCYYPLNSFQVQPMHIASTAVHCLGLSRLSQVAITILPTLPAHHCCHQSPYPTMATTGKNIFDKSFRIPDSLHEECQVDMLGMEGGVGTLLE